ncbi:MAG: DUF4433 domain-containing protein [Spirochaetes bacterium]|nr:DUF4433 domain-containing protein [Spirochaetota bacterium]
MKFKDIKEFHYIVQIVKIPSVLENGILCHEIAWQKKVNGIDSPIIQEKRKKVIIPNGGPLHKYANLYFHARNPMMYANVDNNPKKGNKICIVKISPNVLKLQNVIIADGNASSGYTRFDPFPKGLKCLDKDLIYAEYWNDEDPIIKMQKKRIRCAEVLVPNCVPVKYITGIYLPTIEALESLKKLISAQEQIKLDISVNSGLFFL